MVEDGGQTNPVNPSNTIKTGLFCNYDTITDENNWLQDGVAKEDSQCQFVRLNCQPSSMVNFTAMHYCSFNKAFGFNGKNYVFYPVACFLLYVFIYTLGSTANNYLAPALETITVTFKIPESLAGVTLLAFGNGAPDVFSAIASATSSDDGR